MRQRSAINLSPHDTNDTLYDARSHLAGPNVRRDGSIKLLT
jgi:hypothetical protein